MKCMCGRGVGRASKSAAATATAGEREKMQAGLKRPASVGHFKKDAASGRKRPNLDCPMSRPTDEGTRPAKVAKVCGAGAALSSFPANVEQLHLFCVSLCSFDSIYSFWAHFGQYTPSPIRESRCRLPHPAQVSRSAPPGALLAPHCLGYETVFIG